MSLAYKIALRNLFLHKRRCFAVGAVIFVGMLCMILGNGTIAGMEKGIELNIIKGSFGELTLMSATRRNENLNSQEPLEVIEKYQQVQEVISGQAEVDEFIPMVRGTASVLDISMGRDTLNNMNDITAIFFFGVDFDRYNRMYGDNIKILVGSTLAPGERGVLINKTVRDSIFKQHDVWIIPEGGSIVEENLPKDTEIKIDNLRTRNDLVLMSMSGTTTATDVRVPVKGIFEYRQINALMGTNNLIDLETARECMGYILASDIKTDLSGENLALLEKGEDLADALFSEARMFDESVSSGEGIDYQTLLKPNVARKKNVDLDKGAYTLAQIILKKGISPEAAADRLNRSLQEAGLDGYAKAAPWKRVWPELVTNIQFFRAGLLIFIGVIYLAAILMITSVMSIATVERIDEIGTMRTIGARKGFITRMFVAETSLLALLFGGLGIIAGYAAIFVFDAAGLTTDSSNLQFIFGGSVYYPRADVSMAISGAFLLLMITMISMVYPIFSAGRVKSMDAIKRN